MGRAGRALSTAFVSCKGVALSLSLTQMIMRRVRTPLPTLALVAAVFAVAIAHVAMPVRAQMEQPLQGQGESPEEPVDVYVTALLRRLLEVDETLYRFEADIHLYLTWTDVRAGPNAIASTEAYRAGGDCEMKCMSEAVLSRNHVSYDPNEMCCDGVWLPSISIINVYELPEGRTQAHKIYMNEQGAVGWGMEIHAIYHNSMDFRDFPFDKQHLVMQFAYNHGRTVDIGRFIPSATSKEWFMRGPGDVAPGWDVSRVEVRSHNSSMADLIAMYTSDGLGQQSHPDDPLPMTGNNDNVANMEQLVEFDVVIVIDRHWLYHITNMVIPLLLLVSLSFIAYFIPPEYFDSRVNLHITGESKKIDGPHHARPSIHPHD